MEEFPIICNTRDITDISLDQLDKALRQGFIHEKLYSFGLDTGAKTFLTGRPIAQIFRDWAPDPEYGAIPPQLGKIVEGSSDELLTVVELGSETPNVASFGMTKVVVTHIADLLIYLRTLPNPLDQVAMTPDKQCYHATGAALLAIWRKKSYFPYYLNSFQEFKEYLGGRFKGLDYLNDYRFPYFNEMESLRKKVIQVIWIATKEIPPYIEINLKPPPGIKMASESRENYRNSGTS